MKASMNIPAEMPDNGKDFSNDFFRRFTLRPMASPLVLPGGISRQYLFPTFYGDVTCAMAVFLCDYKKAEALVARELHPLVKPVGATRGRAIVAFSCYEYRNVMNVRPYNEVAVAIPVMVNTPFRPPLLPMIMGGFTRFGYHIAAMPVTSEENRIRGNEIWGLPKVTREIDIDLEGTDCVTTAKELDGTTYLQIVVETDGTPTEFDVSSFLYTRHGGVIMRSETRFNSVFNVKKHMGLLVKKGKSAPRSYLEIGDTPSGKPLRDLDIEEHPFQFRFARGMSSCFDLPETTPPSWLGALNKR